MGTILIKGNGNYSKGESYTNGILTLRLQVAWKPIQNKAPDLWKFLDSFNFRYADYVSLLEHYNKVTIIFSSPSYLQISYQPLKLLSAIINFHAACIGGNHKDYRKWNSKQLKDRWQ